MKNHLKKLSSIAISLLLISTQVAQVVYSAEGFDAAPAPSGEMPLGEYYGGAKPVNQMIDLKSIKLNSKKAVVPAAKKESNKPAKPPVKKIEASRPKPVIQPAPVKERDITAEANKLISDFTDKNNNVMSALIAAELEKRGDAVLAARVIATLAVAGQEVEGLIGAIKDTKLIEGVKAVINTGNFWGSYTFKDATAGMSAINKVENALNGKTEVQNTAVAAQPETTIKADLSNDLITPISFMTAKALIAKYTGANGVINYAGLASALLQSNNPELAANVLSLMYGKADVSRPWQKQSTWLIAAFKVSDASFMLKVRDVCDKRSLKPTEAAKYKAISQGIMQDVSNKIIMKNGSNSASLAQDLIKLNDSKLVTAVLFQLTKTVQGSTGLLIYTAATEKAVKALYDAGASGKALLTASKAELGSMVNNKVATAILNVINKIFSTELTPAGSLIEKYTNDNGVIDYNGLAAELGSTNDSELTVSVLTMLSNGGDTTKAKALIGALTLDSANHWLGVRNLLDAKAAEVGLSSMYGTLARAIDIQIATKLVEKNSDYRGINGPALAADLVSLNDAKVSMALFTKYYTPETIGTLVSHLMSKGEAGINLLRAVKAELRKYVRVDTTVNTAAFITAIDNVMHLDAAVLLGDYTSSQGVIDYAGLAKEVERLNKKDIVVALMGKLTAEQTKSLLNNMKNAKLLYSVLNSMPQADVNYAAVANRVIAIYSANPQQLIKDNTVKDVIVYSEIAKQLEKLGSGALAGKVLGALVYQDSFAQIRYDRVNLLLAQITDVALLTEARNNVVCVFPQAVAQVQTLIDARIMELNNADAVQLIKQYTDENGVINYDGLASALVSGNDAELAAKVLATLSAGISAGEAADKANTLLSKISLSNASFMLSVRNACESLSAKASSPVIKALYSGLAQKVTDSVVRKIIANNPYSYAAAADDLLALNDARLSVAYLMTCLKNYGGYGRDEWPQTFFRLMLDAGGKEMVIGINNELKKMSSDATAKTLLTKMYEQYLPAYLEKGYIQISYDPYGKASYTINYAGLAEAIKTFAAGFSSDDQGRLVGSFSVFISLSRGGVANAKRLVDALAYLKESDLLATAYSYLKANPGAAGSTQYAVSKELEKYVFSKATESLVNTYVTWAGSGYNVKYNVDYAGLSNAIASLGISVADKGMFAASVSIFMSMNRGDAGIEVVKAKQLLSTLYSTTNDRALMLATLNALKAWPATSGTIEDSVASALEAYVYGLLNPAVTY